MSAPEPKNATFSDARFPGRVYNYRATHESNFDLLNSLEVIMTDGAPLGEWGECALLRFSLSTLQKAAQSNEILSLKTL
jgi:hypothetical protein